MQPFKNIFFDLGGVLFNLHLQRTLAAFRELGMPIPESFSHIQPPLRGLPEGQHPFFQLIRKMDVGEVRRDEFLHIMHGVCRPDVTDDEIIAAYETMIEVPASRLALLKQLRSRYKVYLLSNIGDVHWEAAQRMAREAGYPVEECFDHCYCSYELGVAKPDSAIFQRVIEESGVVPGESLYIDDFADNIEAGRAAGLLAYKIDGNTLEEHVPLLFPELAEN